MENVMSGSFSFREFYEELVAYLREKGNQAKVYSINKYHQVKAYVSDKCKYLVKKLKDGFTKVADFFVDISTGEIVDEEEATETVVKEEASAFGVLLLPYLSSEHQSLELPEGSVSTGQSQDCELSSEEKITQTISDFAAVVAQFKLTPNMLKTALNSDKCILHGQELSHYQKIAGNKQYQAFLMTRAKEQGFVLGKSELQKLINRIVVNGRYAPEFMAMVNTYKTKGE